MEELRSFSYRNFAAQFVEEVQQERYVGGALVLGCRLGQREHCDVLAVQSQGVARTKPYLPDRPLGPHARLAGRERTRFCGLIRHHDAVVEAHVE